MRLLVPLIALVTASAAVASVTHARRPSQADRDLELVASVQTGFGITGVPVNGLYPGATLPLTVKISNPYAFRIKIGKPSAKVGASTNRPGCTGAATNLSVVGGGVGSLAIRAHRSKSVVLQVAMPATVDDACQGATFTLSFRASAARA
jgi:hypothetical protein